MTVNLQWQWILRPMQPSSHVPQHSNFKLKMNWKITGTFLCECTPSERQSGWVLRVLARCLGCWLGAWVPARCFKGTGLVIWWSKGVVLHSATYWICFQLPWVPLTGFALFGCLLLVGNLKNCVDVYLLFLFPICFYIYWRDLRVFTLWPFHLYL